MAGAEKSIERPLSPHLQIYRWPLTMALSILHRATGVVAGAGTLLLTWWLFAAATGPESFENAQACIGSVPGLVIMFGFTLSLVFHALNGVRHLVWDVGKGLTVGVATFSGWLVLVLTLLITSGVWAYAYCVWGAGQ